MTQTLGTVKEGDVIAEGPWAGFTVVSAYTRAQAIEDGTLIDISDIAVRFFKIPVAVTSTIWAWLEESAVLHNVGRPKNIQRDVTDMTAELAQGLYLAVVHGSNRGRGDRFTMKLKLGEAEKILLSICGPGDDGEPVITIMEPGEE